MNKINFRFRLTLNTGGVCYVDSTDQVLRVCDNSRGSRVSNAITRIEYTALKRGKPSGWHVTSAEELRQHHIEDIYAVDCRRIESRYLVGIIVVTALTTVLVMSLLVWSYNFN